MQGFSVWSLHVLPMFMRFSSGCSGFSHHQNTSVRSLCSQCPSPSYWLRSGVDLCHAVAAHWSSGWMTCRDQMSLSAVYVTNKILLWLMCYIITSKWSLFHSYFTKWKQTHKKTKQLFLFSTLTATIQRQKLLQHECESCKNLQL